MVLPLVLLQTAVPFSSYPSPSPKNPQIKPRHALLRAGALCSSIYQCKQFHLNIIIFKLSVLSFFLRISGPKSILFYKNMHCYCFSAKCRYSRSCVVNTLWLNCSDALPRKTKKSLTVPKR